jgi:hypothetical protein
MRNDLPASPSPHFIPLCVPQFVSIVLSDIREDSSKTEIHHLATCVGISVFFGCISETSICTFPPRHHTVWVSVSFFSLQLQTTKRPDLASVRSTTTFYFSSSTSIISTPFSDTNTSSATMFVFVELSERAQEKRHTFYFRKATRQWDGMDGWHGMASWKRMEGRSEHLYKHKCMEWDGYGYGIDCYYYYCGGWKNTSLDTYICLLVVVGLFFFVFEDDTRYFMLRALWKERVDDMIPVRLASSVAARYMNLAWHCVVQYVLGLIDR